MSFSKLEGIFGREGLLAKVLAPDYEWRPQQREMAQAVYRTLGDGGTLLVEAPTGVGKSLAYLVPGILWALEARQPLVVSTYTKNLQDQILDKDLPHIRRLIDREIRVLVLKGRGNYLCRNRWEHYLQEMHGTTEAEDLERALGAWARLTQDGDLSEASLQAGRGAARIHASFHRICGESRFCSTSRCTPESGCFFKLSRRQAREAHLLIVNHSLLTIDLFTDAAGLPEWAAVVVDEAHHLPRVAAEPLSFSVSEASLEAILKGLGGRGEPGLTEQLRRALRNHPSKVERTEMLGALRDHESESARLSVLARAFWADLAASPSFPRADQRLRYGPSADIRDLFPASGLDLCAALSEHLGRLQDKIKEVTGVRLGAPAQEMLPILEAERHLDQARELLSHLEELLTPHRSGFIYWIEPTTPSGPSLRAAPLEVGPHLQEALFQRKETVVLTSATLAVHGRFDHMARKLGLSPDGYEGLVLPTPFRLEEQVGAWVVTGVPDPNDPAFTESLARGIEHLARRLRRKMLVLFTSHETLRKVEGVLRGPLEERGVRLLAQGLDGGRKQVRAGFQEQGPAVLLGAASFWEGVDFPGEELEVLIMARLPFLVPTDPLVEAMAERLESEGQDPFRTFYLPEALTRFRQGFGRLIRRLGDRGLFIVVDPRLEARGYGAQFKRSVGTPFRVAAGWEELVAETAAWFERGGDSPPAPQAPPIGRRDPDS